MFLDKYFKKKKDKGSLYGAICATQSLVQLNVCIASQQARTLWFVQAAQGEALAFRSKPRRHPWFSPGTGSWEESRAESPRFLGLAPPGMLLCSNLSLQHAESKIYPSVPAHLWFNRCALVWGPVQHWSAARPWTSCPRNNTASFMALQTQTEGFTPSSPLKQAGDEVYSGKKIPPALSHFPAGPYFSLK